MGGFKDQAILLGPRKSLVGILTLPTASDPDADKPAVVILNAGIIHRVGPNRMFVTLARRLAEAGHIVARFDLSGIGDSDPRGGNSPPEEVAMSDIRDVLDSLHALKQARRFILMGLCSGADQSVFYAAQDSRVKGIIMIDPSIPRTRRYYFLHYGARALRFTSWRNFMMGRHPIWARLRGLVSPGPVDDQPDLTMADLQSPHVHSMLESTYRKAVEGGVKILAVFTGDLESQHNYREQLIDVFPSVSFGDSLQLEYFARTDHTFSPEADRAALNTIICNWMLGKPHRTASMTGVWVSPP